MKSFILSVVLVVLITGLVILNSFCANHVYDAMLGALDAFHDARCRLGREAAEDRCKAAVGAERAGIETLP